MTAEAPPTTSRNWGVDTGRLAAACGVIAVHIHLVISAENQTGVLIWEVLCRWAVPFFFVAAGYYAHRTDTVGGTLRYIATRILPLLLVWNLIYLLLVQPPLDDLWRMFVNGTHAAYHLWFLPSLALCLLLLALLRQVASPRIIFTVGLLFYGVGLVFDAYSLPLFGTTFTHIWDTRNGPFFGFAFVAAGYLLRQRATPVPAAIGVALFAVGALLQFVELLWLYRSHDINPEYPDFVVGTLAMGTGAFIMFSRLPPSPIVRFLGRLGTLAFGIYAVHVLFLTPFQARIHPDLGSLLEAHVLLLATFAFSLATVWLISRVPAFRRFVS